MHHWGKTGKVENGTIKSFMLLSIFDIIQNDVLMLKNCGYLPLHLKQSPKTQPGQ